jgi:O-antigen/teichoic acid export membrane protein
MAIVPVADVTGTSTAAGATGQKRLSLGQNASVNLGGKGLGMVLSLFVSAYVVHRLGLRAFGFWAVISSISAYAQLLDFGVGPSLTRFVALFDEQGDHGGLRHRAASGLWGSIAFAATLTGVAALIVLAIPSSVSADWPAGWQVAVICIGATLGVASIGSVFQAFPNGLGRWDLSNLAQLGGQVAYSVFAVAALWRSDSLAGLGAAGLGGAVVTCLVAYRSHRRLCAHTLSPRHVRKRDLKELWSYGVTVQMVNLVVVINAQADKPVLLAFAPLSFVGLYELGARVAYTLRALPITAFGPLIAQSAREAASGDRGRLRSFYVRTYRAVIALGVAPLVALFGASYALIIAWLGPEFHTSGTVALVLGLGYAINIATGAGTAVAMGAGRPDLDRNYSLLGLALNLLLTIGLGVLFGRWGVIAATALGLAISSVWLIRSVDRWLAASVLSLRGIAGSPGTRGLLAWGAIVGGSSALIASSVGLTSRWAALALGVATLLVFGTVWLIAVTRMGILSIRGLWPFGSDLLSWRRAA